MLGKAIKFQMAGKASPCPGESRRKSERNY
jgi:hypothetical protein